MQINSISIRNTLSINWLMLMTKRLVYMQASEESAAVVVRVDNRDPTSFRGISENRNVFLSNLSDLSAIILIYSDLASTAPPSNVKTYLKNLREVNMMLILMLMCTVPTVPEIY